jgi:hypothetical protein
MFRFALAGSVLAGLMLAGLVRAQEQPQELVDNPQYVSWAQHKPGTSVVMAMTTDAQGQHMEMQITQTLVEVTDDKVVIEVKNKMEMMGMTHEMPAQSVDIDSKVPADQAKAVNLPPGATGSAKEVGTETIEIDGKSYECTVTEFTGEFQGTRSEGKVWSHKDIPGTVAKTEVKTEGDVAANVSMQVKSINKQ